MSLRQLRRDFDSWAPITADDATIAAALERADVPSLLVTIAHLTGDLSLLEGDVRPRTIWRDPYMGVTAEQRARVRAHALEVLKAYRDGALSLPAPPAPEQLRRMMSFLTGESVSDHYLEFLISELGLDGADGYTVPALEALPAAQRAAFHVVVVGAGMSGILAAYRLAQAGISYTVIEKDADVGGTWLQNSYPGCRVDTPNHTYSYSFVPHDWPQFFSTRDVLRDYFQRCATQFGIRDRIRFNTEVEQLALDEEAGIWRVRIRDAAGAVETLRANAVISAVGQLNRPKLPNLPGIDSFGGDWFHTGLWNHAVDLCGKRIGVIGTGASAFQAVPEIAQSAGQVLLFQRTPPWVNPRPEYHDFISEGKHWLLNHVPYYAKWYRMLQFWLTCEGALAFVVREEGWSDPLSVGPANRKLREFLVEHLAKSLKDDPELLAKCIPQYPPGGKRMVHDNGTWFSTLKRDNVELIDDPVAQVTATGVVTAGGRAYDADVLIYATGFHTTRFLWPMEVIGRGGADLRQTWNGEPRAYKGITLPGFPNLFCMYGPNTNVVVNSSIIVFSECEMRYILSSIRLLLESGHRALDCKREVHDAYNRWIDAGNLQAAWGASNVKSWYKNESGRVTQNWPFSVHEFWQQTRSADPADYHFL